MSGKSISGALTLALALSAAIPASAMDQDETELVSANDPANLVKVLDQAGYEVTLGKDKIGDPEITIDFLGWDGSIQFYDCDEETHEGCESLRLIVGFDRKDPMPPELALDIVKEWRFASISLDDDGDPWVSWDIQMDRGMSRFDFISAMRRFSENLDNISVTVFEAEQADDEAKDRD
ncbi:YbjN domain-containing protein [Altererythrobacter sp.]|uniref:YbjN domain-containing protein n=1 Tax=Altererythrobacter sp. TaxID=1872480 RepID=UPI003D0186D2